jgi:acid phosphatase family membrane protein YuiD
VLNNPFLAIPLVAWGIAQVLKVMTSSVQQRRLNLGALASMGGMPSSHTALVVSVTTVIAVRKGVNDPLFAVAAIFSGVVMYDAAGVRRAAGLQARALNRIIEDLRQRQLKEERLRELLGHTPFEVVAGALLGVLVTLALLGL